MAFQMYELGDPIVWTYTVTDGNGNLANAGSVVIYVYRPDGTVAVNGVTVTPGPTGLYSYSYTSADEGRHTAKWVATGANAGVFTDVANVMAGVSTVQSVSLDELRSHLNRPSQTAVAAISDEELRGFLLAACYAVEHIVGVVAVRSFTEHYSGGSCELVLRHPPAVSIVSVTELGVARVSSDYSLSDSGEILTRTYGTYYPGYWAAGYNSVTVTYLAGRTVVPENIIKATAIIVQHLYETQRGTGLPSPGGDSDGIVTPGVTFAVPRRAVELLRPDRISGLA